MPTTEKPEGKGRRYRPQAKEWYYPALSYRDVFFLLRLFGRGWGLRSTYVAPAPPSQERALA